MGYISDWNFFWFLILSKCFVWECSCSQLQIVFFFSSHVFFQGFQRHILAGCFIWPDVEKYDLSQTSWIVELAYWRSSNLLRYLILNRANKYLKNIRLFGYVMLLVHLRPIKNQENFRLSKKIPHTGNTRPSRKHVIQ